MGIADVWASLFYVSIHNTECIDKALLLGQYCPVVCLLCHTASAAHPFLNSTINRGPRLARRQRSRKSSRNPKSSKNLSSTSPSAPPISRRWRALVAVPEACIPFPTPAFLHGRHKLVRFAVAAAVCQRIERVRFFTAVSPCSSWLQQRRSRR